jgi:general secretion pathway protein H
MRTSAAGNSRPAPPPARKAAATGFTLLELLVVVAIIAIATAGVSFALRDSQATQLEREAQRLAALLESARAQSRSSGVAVRWYPTDGGFRFDGVPPDALPERWLVETTQVRGAATLQLGPEPIIGKQEVVLESTALPGRSLRVATDGLRPFSVTAGDAQ